jgi:hypothetical protein
VNSQDLDEKPANAIGSDARGDKDEESAGQGGQQV